MSTTNGTERIERQTQNLSLRPADIAALWYLARLDAHTNLSAAARKLIDQRMRAEIGRDWSSVILTDADAREAIPA